MAGTPPQPPPPRGTMSLYADLLGVSAPPAEAAPAAKPVEPKNPALRFQPIIRRPQQKPKAKLPKAPPTTTTTTTSSASDPSTTTTTIVVAAAAAAARPTLADWTGASAAAADDDYYYDDGPGGGGGPDDDRRPRRGGRKKKKKRLEEKQRRAAASLDIDWDELYDPARPTNMEAYMQSDERVAAARDWRAVLYAHRRQRQRARSRSRSGGSSSRSSDDDDENGGSARTASQFNPAFAPPAAFAPPPSLMAPAPKKEDHDDKAAVAAVVVAAAVAATPPAPPVHEKSRPSDAADVDTGDEAHARRALLHAGSSGPDAAAPEASAAATAVVPSLAAGLVVSRAPVRFEPAVPAEDEDEDMPDAGDDDNGKDTANTDDNEPTPRTSWPGQAGFAARLMAKYGWTKGSGLGADESGIVNPLRHKKLKSGTGRIVGGDRGKKGAATTADATGAADSADSAATTTAGAAGFSSPSPSPSISAVVVLRNMVEGMPDLAAEVADGQLVQEIGEECGSQYGRIERVHIDVAGRLVFIQFVDQVSALRAVNALNGRIFNGNAIHPSFYDAAKFDQGIYE